MEVARINSLEFPTEEKTDAFIANREKKGGKVTNPYATIQMSIRTGPTSMMSIFVFPNEEAAEAALKHREIMIKKTQSEFRFKEEWYLEGEFLQLYQNHMARKFKPE